MEAQNLNIVWLLANGGVGLRNNTKLVNPKNIEAFDIPNTCTMIAQEAANISLQRSSYLLYGTTLVYRRKCDLRFKETLNVKWSIQRVKDLMNCKGAASITTKQKKSAKAKELQLLEDASHWQQVNLLGVDDTVDLEVILKDLEFKQSSSLGLGASLNWKADSGLREMSNSTEISDIKSSDYVSFDAAVPVPITGSDENSKDYDSKRGIWDEELDFGFDINGNTVNANGGVLASQPENQIENAVHRSVTPPDFHFDDFHLDEEDAQMIDEEESKERTRQAKRKKKVSRITNTKKRRLLLDSEICITLTSMRESRDDFIRHEIRKRLQFHEKQDSKFHLPLRFKKYDIFSKMLSEYYPTPHGSSSAEFGNRSFDTTEEIEIGRRRRSSSVSSVEHGRRALDSQGKRRNSSSFQFDLNLGQSQDMLDIDLSANMADMDISLDQSISTVNSVANMDIFMEQLKANFNELRVTKTEFDKLYPLGAVTKREAARNFHMLLHCATKSKIQLSIGPTAIGKSQWDVLQSSDILVKLD